MPLQRPKHFAPGIGLTRAIHCKFGHYQFGGGALN